MIYVNPSGCVWFSDREGTVFKRRRKKKLLEREWDNVRASLQRDLKPFEGQASGIEEGSPPLFSRLLQQG